MTEMGSLEKQKHQAGQATVEYILLLVIGVSLILGLANQMYRPFGDFVDNQMGPYLQCLLDLGELPALGGDASGECVLPPIKPGPKATASVGGSGGGGAASEGANAARRSKRGNGDDGSGNGSGGAGRGRGSGSDLSNKGFAVGKKVGADGPGSETDSGRQMSEKLPESKFMKLQHNGSTVGSINSSSSGYNGIGGQLPAEQVKRERARQAVYQAGLIESGEEIKKPNKLLVKPPERKAASEAAEPPWNFGQYLKLAMIVAIVVAIILFLGGQMSQISKSMEKDNSQ